MSQHPETNPYFSQPPEQREGQPLLQVPPAQQGHPSSASLGQPQGKERPRKQKSQQASQPDGRGGFQSPWWPLKPRQQPQGQGSQPDRQFHSPWEPPHPHDQDHQHPGSILTDPQLQRPLPQVQLQPQPRRDRNDRSSQVTKPQDEGPWKQPGLVPGVSVDHGTRVAQPPPLSSPRDKKRDRHPQPPPTSSPRDQKRDRHPQFTQPQGEEENRWQPTSRQNGHNGEHGLWAPRTHRTKAITWCGAIFCAIFSIIIFLGGLIVLIIYLLYRPRSPHFDIADVTLNTAYLDAGSLLNADVTIYANFTNPNRKMSVDFRNLILDLYYEDTLISTQYVEPFRVAKASFQTAYVHMITSQVTLPLKDGQTLEDQIVKNAVIFKLKGYFRVRSYLASFLKYSYKLHGNCIFMVTAPPSGVHRAIRCKSKR